jgi:hypothetical protein
VVLLLVLIPLSLVFAGLLVWFALPWTPRGDGTIYWQTHIRLARVCDSISCAAWCMSAIGDGGDNTTTTAAVAPEQIRPCIGSCLGHCATQLLWVWLATSLAAYGLLLGTICCWPRVK